MSPEVRRGTKTQKQEAVGRKGLKIKGVVVLTGLVVVVRMEYEYIEKKIQMSHKKYVLGYSEL